MSASSTEPVMSLANVGTGLPPSMTRRSSITGETTVKQKSLLSATFLSSPVSSLSRELMPPLSLGYLVASRRGRSSSMTEHDRISAGKFSPSGSLTGKKVMSVASASLAIARARNAQKENDAMVYLDGQQIYSCAQCRTHLTSHDDIISKSFHGRNGRAYLFDHCVNVIYGKPEERRLMTGLHRVSDLSCKRCKTMVGWFYDKAYEASQQYKEKKFILEKVNLRMEESMNYELIPLPAGERRDRWKRRSMNWSRDDYRSRAVFTPEHGISDATFEYQHSKLPSEVSDGDDCE